MAIIIK
jgi:hypothetical protein